MIQTSQQHNKQKGKENGCNKQNKNINPPIWRYICHRERSAHDEKMNYIHME